MDKTAQLVRDTKELVHNMDRASLADLRSLHEPPECIQALLAAVIVIGQFSIDCDWSVFY